MARERQRHYGFTTTTKLKWFQLRASWVIGGLDCKCWDASRCSTRYSKRFPKSQSRNWKQRLPNLRIAHDLHLRMPAKIEHSKVWVHFPRLNLENSWIAGYTYIYIYIYIYMHTLYIYIYAYTYTLHTVHTTYYIIYTMDMCMYIYIYIYIHTHVYTIYVYVG